MQLFACLFATSIFLHVCRTGATVDFSWEYVESEAVFQIEISTTYSGDASAQYVAVAFGLEPQMKDADGYYCNSQSLKSFAIQNAQEMPRELNSLQGAQLKAVSDQNGKLSCSFTRPVSVTKTVSGGAKSKFDFKRASYYILTASGKLSGGVMQYHGSEDRDVSTNKEDFSSALPNYNAPITAERCDFKYKSCLTSPSGCTPDNPSCNFFSVRQVDDRLVIELSGGVGQGLQYVAVAFASEDKMKDADMYYCDGKSLRSGVIRKQHLAPVDLDDKSVKVLRASTTNGIGQCVFSRAGCITKEISSGIREKFNVFKIPYYILVAHGDMSTAGKLQYHGVNGSFSTPGAVPLGADQGIDEQCHDIDLSPEVINSDLCHGSNQICLRHPNECHPSSPECTFVSIEQNGSSFNIKMSGGIGGGKEYVAVGFALDPTMNDMDFYYCDGRNVKSGVIRDGSSSPDVVTHGKDLLNAKASTTRGIGHCSFTRPACVTRDISNQKKHSFDLMLNEYLINIAVGPIQSDGRISHSKTSGVTFVKGDPLGTKEDSEYECVSSSALHKPGHMMLIPVLSLTLKIIKNFL